MQKKFHHLGRAIIIQEGKVLLAHALGHSNTFLPGGHIEIGESAVTTLPRELKEEIGVHCEVGRFVGLLEGEWLDEQNDVHHFEVNQVFEVTSAELRSDSNPQSMEDHLEFFWVPATLDALAEANLLPIPFRELVASIEDHRDSSWWKSTIRS